MLQLVCLGFLTVLSSAAGSVQYPAITQCPDVKNPLILIDNVTISNSQLGKEVDITVVVHNTAPLDSNPVLEISISSADGTQLPCIDAVIPCELKLCDGTTSVEEELNREWNNQCPIPAGTYNAHMSFYLPNHPLGKLYFKDGNIVISLSIEEDGQVVGCASYPVYVEVDG